MTKKGSKGWWSQMQTGEYPESNTSYGQEIDALDTRRLEKSLSPGENTKKSKGTDRGYGDSSIRPPSPELNYQFESKSHSIYRPKPESYRSIVIRPKDNNKSSGRPKTAKPKNNNKRSNMPKATKPKNNYSHYIVCGCCSHGKVLTIEAMDELKRKTGLSGKPFELSVLAKSLGRLKCSKCGAKKAELKIGKHAGTT